MARMNPKRRLIAKLKKAQLEAHKARVSENAASTDNVQIMGASRKGNTFKANSSLAKFDTRIGSHKPPREKSWEGTGRPGKVIAGKFKPTKPGVRQRFAKS